MKQFLKDIFAPLGIGLAIGVLLALVIVVLDPIRVHAGESVSVEMFRETPEGTGIMLCPSEWMVSKGEKLSDIYCQIPIEAYNRWMEEDHAISVDPTCAAGYEQQCFARDSGTDGLRRSPQHK